MVVMAMGVLSLIDLKEISLDVAHDFSLGLEVLLLVLVGEERVHVDNIFEEAPLRLLH